MKKIIFILILAMYSMVSLASASIFTGFGSWYNENHDKISHGLLGAATAGYALKRLADPSTAILDSGLVGIAKEYVDSRGFGNPDVWDFTATLIGGVLLVIL